MKYKLGEDRMTSTYFLTGSQACVEGAITAGCRVCTGYPITPANEILEIMAERLPRVGGFFVQMEDELAALAVVIGAAWGGLKGMTATSGPGFSLMQENLGYAVITETPCVIVNVQRGGPSTGQPTLPSHGDIMQAKYGSHGDYEIIAYAPAYVQEMLDLTIEAFNFSETYRVPVILLADATIAHMREKVKIPSPDEIVVVNRKIPTVPPERYIPFKPDENGVPPMVSFGEGYKILVDGQVHDERGYRAGHLPEVAAKLQRRLCDKIARNVDRIVRLEEEFVGDSDIAVLSYGITARASLEAVKRARQKGIKASYFRLITIWPFAERQVRELSEQVHTIIVPELNIGKLVKEVKSSVVPGVKVVSLPKLGGELPAPEEILAEIRRF